MRAPARGGFAGALALLALALVAAAGWRPLMLPDEGRYVGVAWEMLQARSATPLLFGLPYFHKPPLMYAIDALAMAAFGVNGWTARAAPLAGAFAMALALAFEVRRVHGAAAVAPALALLATLPFFFVGAQFANHDMLVAGLVAAAIVAARHALAAAGRPAFHRALALAWGAAALALLAKGLIGVVLPALVLLPWLAAQGRWRDVLRLLHPLGLAVFALVALPWCVAMELRHPGFLDYFFVGQHFRRYTGAGFNNPHPFWFYAAVLPLLALPASLALPRALRDAWRAGGRSEAGFALWWLLAVLLFFSLPRSKLVGYVLPALPALVLLLGPVVARWRRRGLLLGVAAAACLATLAGLAWKGPRDHRDLAQALAARLAPADAVVYVAEPFFDLRLHAGLARPPAILDAWDDAATTAQDDWRREVFDAARFAPERGREVLWRDADLARRLCAPGAVWLVVGRDRAPPAAAAAALQFSGARGTLWRAEGGPAHPGCR